VPDPLPSPPSFAVRGRDRSGQTTEGTMSKELRDQLPLPGVAKAGPRGAPESPAEEALLAAFLSSGFFRKALCPSDTVVATSPLGMLLSQVPVTVGRQRYRLDFAVVQPEGRAWIGIEVDGHEFHHDRAQVEYDRQRERALTASGWRVLRFTASEVFGDAPACVAEVVELLQTAQARARGRESGNAA
jgi:very-short-patch-repair endonuclease